MGPPQRRPRAQTVLPEPDGGKSLFNDGALGSVVTEHTPLPEIASVPRNRGDLMQLELPWFEELKRLVPTN